MNRHFVRHLAQLYLWRMASKLDIEKAAKLLYEAAENNEFIFPVREIIGGTDIDAAYEVQEINITKRLAKGSQVVGKKIGLTSFAVQKQLGVDQPDYGILLDSMEVRDGEISITELMQPKAEAEIAFRMKKKMDGEITMESLIDAIDYALVSIEVVGSRIADWNIKITDTIADNASASHFMLGSKKVDLEELDLVNCKMTLTKNGEIASEGSGKACMDNPLNAALWLAKKMAEQGSHLQKDEILLSGALGPMVPISVGDSFEATIEGLGSVSLNINS